MIVDPGKEERVAMEGGVAKYEQEFNRYLDERVQGAIAESYGTDLQKITTAQCLLRSFGIRNEDGSRLEITGINAQNDPKLARAVEQYEQMKSSFFTPEEAAGISGTTHVDMNEDGEADADIGYGNDDVDLYADPWGSIEMGGELYTLAMDMNLDENPKEPNAMQVRMMQGFMNTMNNAGLVVDGEHGSASKAAIEDFFAREDVQEFVGKFDNVNQETLSLENGLNSNHFEIMRNWAVANNDKVQDAIMESRDAEIEVGRIKSIMGNGYNETVLDMQASMNMIGHLTTMDGLYGGQTDGNINQFSENPRDPDADFKRDVSEQGKYDSEHAVDFSALPGSSH